MPRLIPPTDRQISHYTSKIGAKGGARRWEGFSAAKRKELMAQIRASKQSRPKAGDAFHIANSVFLTEIESGDSAEGKQLTERIVARAKEKVALLSPVQEAAPLDQWSCYFMGVKQALANPFKEELPS